MVDGVYIPPNLDELMGYYRSVSNKNAVPDSLSAELSRPMDLSQTPTYTKFRSFGWNIRIACGSKRKNMSKWK